MPSHRQPIPARRPQRTRRRIAALPSLAAIAALGLCVLLAACGSSSPATSNARAASSERESEAKIAQFAKCMREHGVQAESVAGPNGARGLTVKGNKGQGAQSLEAAQKACARYQPQPKRINLSPQEKVEHEEQVQKFARCMREHGIKVEASTQGGGLQIRIHAHPGEAGAPNPESPGFQAAQTNCQKLLPFKTPGPGDAVKGTSGGPEGPGKPGSGAGLSLSAGG